MEQATILIVDDDESLIVATRRLLGQGEPDWQILTAHDGREALEIVARQQVAVVLTDLQMPGVDGFKLLKHLAEHHPGTVRVVHSSQAAAPTEMARAAAHRVIHKPAEPSHLLAIVRWAVRQHDMWTSG